MPLFEYECSKCLNKIEVLQKHDDPDPVHCVLCDTPTLIRVISSGSFRIHGGGVYKPTSRIDK